MTEPKKYYQIDWNNEHWMFIVSEEGDDKGEKNQEFLFTDYQIIVDCVLNSKKKITIYDCYYNGCIEVDNGKVTRITDECEPRNESLEELWGLKVEKNNEDYYEPDCSNCGDGGCYYCEPHRYL